MQEQQTEIESNIIGLMHLTHLEYLRNILEYGILTNRDRHANRIYSKGIFSYFGKQDFDAPYHDVDCDGVYCSMIYRDRPIKMDSFGNDIFGRKICENPIGLILPVDTLLNRRDYHVNLYDDNGIFSANSYEPHEIMNLPKYEDLMEYYDTYKIREIPNEVVFHNSIPKTNIVEIWVENPSILPNISEILEEKGMTDSISLRSVQMNQKYEIQNIYDLPSFRKNLENELTEYSKYQSRIMTGIYGESCIWNKRYPTYKDFIKTRRL
jgi:hypothetical protein